MPDETQVAPDSSAQATTPADNQDSPLETDTSVQEPGETAQLKVAIDGETSQDSNTTEQQAEQIPLWEKKGFKNEEEFARSFDESRSTLGRLHREKASLAKRTKTYEDYINGKLETEDLTAHIKNQESEQKKIDDQYELGNEKAKLAIEIFKVQNDKLGDKDMVTIINLAQGSNSTVLSERLDYGFQAYKGIQTQAEEKIIRAAAKKTQEEMSLNSEVVTGSSNKTEPPKFPDFKNMSDEDFAKYRQNVLSQ